MRLLRPARRPLPHRAPRPAARRRCAPSARPGPAAPAGTRGAPRSGRLRALLRTAAVLVLSFPVVLAAVSPSAAAAPAAAARACTPSVEPGVHSVPVDFDGRSWAVTVHVPALAPGEHPPLVLDLHGSGSTGRSQLAYSDLGAAADAGGFVVAAPDGAVASGTGWIWNVPGVTPNGTRDDTAFLGQVIDTLTQAVCADPSRVYSTGYSGGGRMTSALACALSDRIAAIAPVAGLRAGRPDPADPAAPDPASCTPGRAVPVITFHGLLDATNPYDGGGREYWQYGVPTAQRRWAELNGCQDGPTTTQVSEHVRATAYTACRDGADVVLYTVADGGHDWPGSPAGPPAEISANELLRAFFSQYRLPAAPAGARVA